MKKILAVAILTSFACISVSTATFADSTICTEETPCIVSVLASIVTFYREDLSEAKRVNRKDFEELLKDKPLKTQGRKEINGITLLAIKDPDSSDAMYLDETAFQLDPSPRIDCTGIVAARTLTSPTSTTGMSVGLGDACDTDEP